MLFIYSIIQILSTLGSSHYLSYRKEGAEWMTWCKSAVNEKKNTCWRKWLFFLTWSYLKAAPDHQTKYCSCAKKKGGLKQNKKKFFWTDQNKLLVVRRRCLGMFASHLFFLWTQKQAQLTHTLSAEWHQARYHSTTVIYNQAFQSAAWVWEHFKLCRNGCK